MPNSDSNNAQRDKSFETVKSALIGLLFVLLGWQYSSFQKLEDRVFTMSTTTMTQSAGLQMEDRLNRNMETRFTEMYSKLDLILRLVQSDKGK